MMSRWIKLILLSGLVATLLWANDERGLGGTGRWLGNGDDRGIGGTGVIGTITEFGSIWVNGLEIELDDATQVTMDGRVSEEAALRLGQQVKVLAAQRQVETGTEWFARKVLIDHALIGQVERNDGHGVTIQGVHVLSDPKRPGEWPTLQLGDQVKVSGYFHRGRLFATDVSKVEHIDEWQISAPVTRNMWGQWRVAGLPLPDDVLEAQEGEMLTLRGQLNQVQFIRHDDGVPFANEVDAYVIEHRSPDRSDTLHFDNDFERVDSSRGKMNKGDDRGPNDANGTSKGMPSSMYDVMRQFERSRGDADQAEQRNPSESRARFERQPDHRSDNDDGNFASPAGGLSITPSDSNGGGTGNSSRSGQSSPSNERAAPSRENSRASSSGSSSASRDRGGPSTSNSGRGGPPNRGH